MDPVRKMLAEYEQSANNYRDAHNYDMEARMLEQVVIMRSAMNEPHIALTQAQRLADVYHKIDNKKRGAITYMAISQMYERLGDLNLAIENREKAILILELLQDPEFDIESERQVVYQLKRKRGDEKVPLPPALFLSKEEIDKLLDKVLVVCTVNQEATDEMLQFLEEYAQVLPREWIDEIIFVNTLHSIITQDIARMERVNPYADLVIELMRKIEAWWEIYAKEQLKEDGNTHD